MHCYILTLHANPLINIAYIMKKKGSFCDFRDSRAAELRAAFFSQDLYSTGNEVMKQIVKTPSSRFWVEPERARDVLSRFEKNPQSIARMHPERQRMYLVLYERYKELRIKNPTESKISCVTMAIYSGAPEFFLSPSTARSILYN